MNSMSNQQSIGWNISVRRSRNEGPEKVKCLVHIDSTVIFPQVQNVSETVWKQVRLDSPWKVHSYLAFSGIAEGEGNPDDTSQSNVALIA